MRDPDLPPARRKQIRALLTDEEIEAIRAIYRADQEFDS